MANKVNLQLLNLPEELLDNIVSYLSYDDISHLRLVCQKFNKCCSRLLNQGFLKVERYHSQCLRDIKAQLPRRESERRDHPLARHSDILTAIETRLSLLSMTFMKYVDMGLCCFIPGKVIDEIYSVLRNIQATATPPRSHEILQELRDISSMAMEHFDEHIVPLLKQRIGASRRTIALPSGNLSLTGSPRGNNTCIGSTLKQELKKIQSGLKQVTTTNTNYKKEQAELRKKMLDYERKLLEFNEIKKRLKELEKTSTDLKRTHVTSDQSDVKKKMREMEKKISDQNQLLRENSTRLAEQDGKISEMSRKLLEYDRHVAELLRSRDQCLGDEQVASTSVAKNIKSKTEPNSDTATINNKDTETSDLHNINIEKEDTKISSTKCSVSVEAAQSKNCSKGVKSSNGYKRNSSALGLERDTKRSKQKKK